MYTLLYSKGITSKNVLHSTWTSTQHCVPAWMEVGLEGKGSMYTYSSVPSLFT